MIAYGGWTEWRRPPWRPSGTRQRSPGGTFVLVTISPCHVSLWRGTLGEMWLGRKAQGCPWKTYMYRRSAHCYQQLSGLDSEVLTFTQCLKFVETSFIHSFIHSFIISFIHSFIISLFHSFIQMLYKVLALFYKVLWTNPLCYLYVLYGS